MKGAEEHRQINKGWIWKYKLHISTTCELSADEIRKKNMMRMMIEWCESQCQLSGLCPVLLVQVPLRNTLLPSSPLFRKCDTKPYRRGLESQEQQIYLCCILLCFFILQRKKNCWGSVTNLMISEVQNGTVKEKNVMWQWHNPFAKVGS